MLTQPGVPPPFQRGGMGDHGTGLAAAGAISAALFQRERSGKGQLVSTSLLRQGVYTLSFDLATALRFGVGLAVGNRKTMGNPCINVYADRDGRWFWIVGLEGERHWPPLARAVGHPEWLSDPRFATPAERAKNAAALIAELDAVFATKPLAEWKPIFDGTADFWWSPVQNLEEVMADPQVQRRGRLRRGAGRRLRRRSSPTRRPTSTARRRTPRWMAPALGQHSDEVLARARQERNRAQGALREGSGGLMTRVRANGIELDYDSFGKPLRAAAAPDHGPRRPVADVGRGLLRGARGARAPRGALRQPRRRSLDQVRRRRHPERRWS